MSLKFRIVLIPFCVTTFPVRFSYALYSFLILGLYDCLGYVSSNGRMIAYYELGRMWKEVVVVYFKTLPPDTVWRKWSKI